MARLLKADGTEEVLPGPLSLDQMQAAVGGYIEVLTLGWEGDGVRHVLVVDEEGRLKDKRVNQRASALYGRDFIVGDAIVATVFNGGSEDPATPERWE